MKLKIEYFAILRERAGLDHELIETDFSTPAELFAELTKRHGFPEMETVKVAINDEFGDWHAQLQDGDSIVFIPPVAGG
jgi:molybdopterin converting factor subunit 1